jgi:hypothetical protein
MTALFASHTMPSLWEMLGGSGPLCIGAMAVLLAVPFAVTGSRGARSVARLSLARHVAAVLGGTALALVAFVVVAAVGVALVPGAWAVLLGVGVGGLGGEFLSYWAARFVAARMNWFTCRGCGAWFRARGPARYCPDCDAERDRAELADALAEFDRRYERTRPPPGT